MLLLELGPAASVQQLVIAVFRQWQQMSVSLLRRNKFPICSSLSAAAAAAGRIMRGATWWWSSSTLLITTHEYIHHPSPRFLHISVVDIIVSEAYSSDCHQDIVSRGGGGAGRGAIPADSSHHHRTRSSRHLGWSRPRLNIFYCAEINITSPPSTSTAPGPPLLLWSPLTWYVWSGNGKSWLDLF